MSLLEKKPLKLTPRSCGLCRHFAPWLRQEFLGTCGGEKMGDCVDVTETCAGFEAKKETAAPA